MTSPSGSQNFRLATLTGSLLAVAIGGILYYGHSKTRLIRPSQEVAVAKPPKDDPSEVGAKPVAESVVDVSYRVTADVVDEHGRMFAGEILKLVDIVAGVASRRHAETGVVTISLDRFILVQEVKVGDVLHLSAAVNRAWTSSMAYLTFVALARSPDGHSGPPASIRLPGRKVEQTIIRPKVKKVVPATLIEKKRYLLAGHRRELRLAAGKKANGGMAAFRAEVLTMSSSLHSEITMSPGGGYRSKVISDMEKDLIADALAENDPSVVHSITPTGEEVVSLSPGLYDGLGSPAP
ncbi:Acyl-coenzyme A thioesterase 12, partial [Tulasnella sp. 408]